MFDALARRTVFSKLDNESMNLVIAFHGGTMFGVPAYYLTPQTIEFLRRYRDLWEHFSYKITMYPQASPSSLAYRGRMHQGDINFTIKFKVDTLQQKCAILPLLRKKEGVVVGYGGKRHELEIGGFRSAGENIKVYLKDSPYCRGVWKRVADLEDITFKSIFLCG